MSFNPVGNILCQRCENFVDGHDCNKCGWEQPPYEEDPLTKAEARIEELETELEKSDKIAWDHFYIHQEVFNYLLSQGYIHEVVDGDTWEAAAQNIINGIKNIEGKLK